MSVPPVASEPSFTVRSYSCEKVVARMLLPADLLDAVSVLERSIRRLVSRTARAVFRMGSLAVEAEDEVHRRWVMRAFGVGAGTVPYLRPIDEVWTDYRATAQAWVDVEPEHADRLAGAVVNPTMRYVHMAVRA